VNSIKAAFPFGIAVCAALVSEITLSKRVIQEMKIVDFIVGG
jgi:hypothetical protein